MPIQNHITCVRLDSTTNFMLKELIHDFDFNKSQVMRYALRLLKELNEIKKKTGQILIRTEAGEKVIVLLS